MTTQRSAEHETASDLRRTQYRLVTDPRWGWRVVRSKDGHAVLKDLKKTNLVSRARRLARERHAELLIFDREGRLQERVIAI